MKLARLKKPFSRDDRAVAAAVAAPSTPGAWPCSVVGRELVASGRLEARGELRIHGRVRGEVCAPKVVLCADGRVDGTVVAGEAVLEGWLKGRVFALRVTATESAVIEGTLFHHEIAMAPGVRFEGRLPWRPKNWFEEIPEDLYFDEAQGDADEHVRAQ